MGRNITNPLINSERLLKISVFEQLSTVQLGRVHCRSFLFVLFFDGHLRYRLGILQRFDVFGTHVAAAASGSVRLDGYTICLVFMLVRMLVRVIVRMIV